MQKLTERNQLSAEERSGCSRAIAEHLWRMPEYLQATALHAYLPIHNEVNTCPLIERAWQEGKTVIVPVVVAGDPELHHRVFLPNTRVVAGQYGILEPATGEIMSTLKLPRHGMIVLVPLVAFDRQLYRIGYGKGYYDRFLSQIQAVRIGLAYSFQFVEHFEHNQHDVQLDAVVTEHGVVR